MYHGLGHVIAQTLHKLLGHLPRKKNPRHLSGSKMSESTSSYTTAYEHIRLCIL